MPGSNAINSQNTLEITDSQQYANSAESQSLESTLKHLQMSKNSH